MFVILAIWAPMRVHLADDLIICRGGAHVHIGIAWLIACTGGICQRYASDLTGAVWLLDEIFVKYRGIWALRARICWLSMRYGLPVDRTHLLLIVVGSPPT